MCVCRGGVSSQVRPCPGSLSTPFFSAWWPGLLCPTRSQIKRAARIICCFLIHFIHYLFSHKEIRKSSTELSHLKTKSVTHAGFLYSIFFLQQDRSACSTEKPARTTDFFNMLINLFVHSKEWLTRLINSYNTQTLVLTFFFPLSLTGSQSFHFSRWPRTNIHTHNGAGHPCFPFQQVVSE